MPMLTALMPFPVILATECLIAVVERTAVRLFMSFHVFPATLLVNEERDGE